jgi:hypothetical protein
MQPRVCRSEGQVRGLLWWSMGCHWGNGEMSGSCWKGGEREEDGIHDEGDSRVRRE